jgi:hypothetical protein
MASSRYPSDAERVSVSYSNPGGPVRHARFTLTSAVTVLQELLRHSSFRSTLDVYTQAVVPAKHAAQAAVISLVFSSDKDGPALVAG